MFYYVPYLVLLSSPIPNSTPTFQIDINSQEDMHPNSHHFHVTSMRVEFLYMPNTIPQASHIPMEPKTL
jgi:hypothetical protein